MQLRIRQGKGVHLLQPGIFLLISGRCVPEHLFFFLVIADLVRKHLVIDKAAAADCFLYLNSLLFIWIDPYFYGAVHFLTLAFYILPYRFNRRPACTEQTEALAPECIFPEFFSYLGILFFQQPAAGAFIGIDEFTEFRLWLCAEHHMNMVCIVIPFFQYDPVSGCDILKDLFCSFGYFVVQYFSSVFYNHHR